MAAQMLLINPKRRRRRAKKNSRARRRVRVNARRRRRHARVNPRHHARRKVRVIRLNPHHRHHRRRRAHRNPFSRGLNINSIVRNELMPAAIGAVGAVGMDVVWGYLSPMLGTTISGNSFINAAAKSAGAVGLGMLASKTLGPDKGRAVAVGALTVIAYELVSGLVKAQFPTLPMAGLGAYMPPLSGFGAYMPAPNMGAYLPSPMGRLSGYNPAPYLSGLEDRPGTGAPYGAMTPMLSGLDGIGNMGDMGHGMF